MEPIPPLNELWPLFLFIFCFLDQMLQQINVKGHQSSIWCRDLDLGTISIVILNPLGRPWLSL